MDWEAFPVHLKWLEKVVILVNVTVLFWANGCRKGLRISVIRFSAPRAHVCVCGKSVTGLLFASIFLFSVRHKKAKNWCYLLPFCFLSLVQMGADKALWRCEKDRSRNRNCKDAQTPSPSASRARTSNAKLEAKLDKTLICLCAEKVWSIRLTISCLLSWLRCSCPHVRRCHEGGQCRKLICSSHLILKVSHCQLMCVCLTSVSSFFHSSFLNVRQFWSNLTGEWFSAICRWGTLSSSLSRSPSGCKMWDTAQAHVPLYTLQTCQTHN